MDDTTIVKLKQYVAQNTANNLFTEELLAIAETGWQSDQAVIDERVALGLADLQVLVEQKDARITELETQVTTLEAQIPKPEEPITPINE